MSEATAQPTLTPYEDSTGLHYIILGVTAVDVVLTGAGGKTQTVPLETLKEATAGARVNVKLVEGNGSDFGNRYSVEGAPIAPAEPTTKARTNSGRAGNVGNKIESGIGRTHDL